MATRRKTSTAQAAATETAAVDEAPAPEDGEAQAPLDKSGLIDEVVIASGVRKRDAKPVVEAMLAIMGRALDEGRTVKAAPLGQLRPVKSNAGGRAVTHTVKLRRTPGPRDAPAEVAEDEGAG